MQTLTGTLEFQTIVPFNNENYEVIANETLSNCKHEDLIVSGSLLSLSTFENVTFLGCVFYGSIFDNCIFKNCKFIDCKFEFVQIASCKFKGSHFSGCEWISSSLRHNDFLSTELCHKTSYFAFKNANSIEGCYQDDKLTWQKIKEDLMAA